MAECRHTDSEILADLREVAGTLGHAPTEREYREIGQFSAYLVRDRFGSLPAARELAGLERGQRRDWTDEELLRDLRSVAKEVGHPPTQTEYNDLGKVSVRTIHNRFGGWIDARDRAGLEGGAEQNQWVPESKLIEEIRRIADKVGTAPTKSNLEEFGQYSEAVYYDRFGSWPKAVRQAGFEPRRPGAQPGEENHAWRGGELPGYYGPNWEEQRGRALERDGYRCYHCGLSQEVHLDIFGEELAVHHITPRREFIDEDGVLEFKLANQIDNLVTLCNRHHGLYEWGSVEPDDVPGVAL